MVGKGSYGGECPLPDEATPVVDDTVSAGVVAVVGPAARAVVAFEEGQDEEEQGGAGTEETVGEGPVPEVEVGLVEAEEVDEEEDEGQTHRHPGHDQQHRLPEEDPCNISLVSRSAILLCQKSPLLFDLSVFVPLFSRF